MINAKRKGSKGEHDFAHWLLGHGVKAYRNSMSGGSVWKGDIGNNIDCTFEVKTVKKINLQEAWRQVEKDSSIAHNMPVLAIRFDKMPKNEWLMVFHSEDAIEMLKKFHGL